MEKSAFDPVTLELLWTRLISATDEAAAAEAQAILATYGQERSSSSPLLLGSVIPVPSVASQASSVPFAGPVAGHVATAAPPAWRGPEAARPLPGRIRV